jgi:LemA protein
MNGWIIVAVLTALALYVIFVFNRLVRLRNLAREAWSGTDVQLKRRSDLVPNLVATVQAYAVHERGVLQEVTARRQSSLAAGGVVGRASAEQALQGALGKLFAVAEAYPDLKADKNFLSLQEQLAQIEDQLQMARRYYNGTVRNLNIGIQSFPDNLFAAVFGFRAQPFFELEDRAQAVAPSVAFQAPKARGNDYAIDASPRPRACHCGRGERAGGRGRAHPALRQRCRGRAQRRSPGHRVDPRAGGPNQDPARHLSRFPDRL